MEAITGHTGLVTEQSGHALAVGQDLVAETRQTYDAIAAEYARQNSVKRKLPSGWMSWRGVSLRGALSLTSAAAPGVMS